MDYLQIKNLKWRLKAEQELYETDETRQKSLAKFKRMLTDDPQMKIELNDEFLLIFLRSKKFNLDHTFTKLKVTCQLITARQYWLPLSSLDALKYALDSGIYSVSDQNDHAGRKVVTILFGKWDPAYMNLDSFFVSFVLFMVGLGLCDENLQVTGFVVVFDVCGFGFKHALHITPKVLHTFALIIKDICPLRLKQIHLTNFGRLTKMLYAAFLPLLGTKIRKRMFMYEGGSSSVLHEKIAPHLLPSELGGTCPDSKQSPYLFNILNEIEERGFIPVLRSCGYGN